jgi:hypothetical protein
MPLRFALPVIGLALTAMAANAADLPAPTRLGAIFAEPAEHRAVAYESPVVILPWVANSPKVPGYYGRAGAFYYSSYYGTPNSVIFDRLPYACPYYGC